jgi:hypothetical protein
MKYQDIQFISADSIVSEVKIEMESYFESGAISEILIPTYIDIALRKLEFKSLKDEEAVMSFVNYKSRLPDDFHRLEFAVSYASEVEWIAGPTSLVGTWTKNITSKGYCHDDQEYTIHEQITMIHPGYRVTLNRPRWLRVYFESSSMCVDNCENLRVQSMDSLRIKPNGEVESSFRTGDVYLKYRSIPTDEKGLRKVPEIIQVEEYIKSFLKFKFFEQLFHSVTDETIRQIQYKLDFYKMDQMRKFEAARNTLMRTTVQQDMDAVVRRKRKFFRFHIR